MSDTRTSDAGPDEPLLAEELHHPVEVLAQRDPQQPPEGRGPLAARQRRDGAVVEHPEPVWSTVGAGQQPEVAGVRVGVQEPDARGPAN